MFAMETRDVEEKDTGRLPTKRKIPKPPTSPPPPPPPQATTKKRNNKTHERRKQKQTQTLPPAPPIPMQLRNKEADKNMDYYTIKSGLKKFIKPVYRTKISNELKRVVRLYAFVRYEASTYIHYTI